MYKHLPLAFSVLLLSVTVRAQNSGVPWRAMTDSVRQVLHLSEDQVERTRLIDEHYDQERHKLHANDQLTAPQRDRALNGLTSAREKEMRGVLTKAQFDQWVGRPKRPAPQRSKGGTRP